MTIQQAVDAFLIDQQVRGNSPHTLRYYRDTLGRFSAFLGPKLVPCLLSTRTHPLSLQT